MKRSMLIATLAIALLSGRAFSFNLWHDIQQQTQWTLGENAAAGTSLDLKNGQFDGSEFAGIASYRFLSGWYGGIDIPQSDKTVKFTDALKIGFNLNYFMTGFVNKPPEFLQRLVIGPAIACSIISSPRVVNYFLDVNYVFGSISTVPMPPATLPAPPSVTPTSKLNLFYGPTSS
jgi:hypothetical protein